MRAPEFWYARRDAACPDAAWPNALWPALLGPAAALYAAAGILRQAVTVERPAPVPVVCIGNLVAGGAGKTPVALAVAELARAAGAAPVFLTRGYGGRLRGPVRVDAAMHTAADVGDEPLLLAAAAPTWVSPDRVAGAVAAAADGDVIIMDDGYQNPRLKKDLSLLVIDGASGFGNGHVMPAGPLREPVAHGVVRADAVVMIGDDTYDTAARLATLPVLQARLVPVDADAVTGRRFVAFAGIGRPAKFFATLTATGADVVATRAFPDHHPYTDTDLVALRETARSVDAALITTAKDAVRLPAASHDDVVVLEVGLSWADPDAVSRLLDPVLAA